MIARSSPSGGRCVHQWADASQTERGRSKIAKTPIFTASQRPVDFKGPHGHPNAFFALLVWTHQPTPENALANGSVAQVRCQDRVETASRARLSPHEAETARLPAGSCSRPGRADTPVAASTGPSGTSPSLEGMNQNE
jgi:hypothetical protein